MVATTSLWPSLLATWLSVTPLPAATNSPSAGVPVQAPPGIALPPPRRD